MPKNITNVSWTASDLPSGLSFDSTTGTFSGTPNEPGEYCIPVSVTTNYGSDTKDVMIMVDIPYIEVEPPLAEVYAIGNKADLWSEGAVPDKYGFRKLNMPKVTKLINLYKGFAAKVADGKFWACGEKVGCLGLDGNEIEANKPFQYPVDNIAEMLAWGVSGSTTGYFVYRTNQNQAYKFYCSGSNTAVGRRAILKETYDNVIRLSSDEVSNYNSTQCVLLMCDSSSYYKRSDKSTTNGLPFYAKKVKKLFSFYDQEEPLFLMHNGDLWITTAGKLNFPDKIIDVFYDSVIGSNYILTQNNELFTIQTRPKDRTEIVSQEKVFDGKVVRIIEPSSTGAYATFLLTEDGRLFFKGWKSFASTYGITIPSDYQEFTQIFPDYRFGTIAGSSATLIATIIKE